MMTASKHLFSDQIFRIFLYLHEKEKSIFGTFQGKNDIYPPQNPILDKPQGPPYILDRPGALSFKIGHLKFHQNIYDRKRNFEPIMFRPGKLSFRIGPLKFRQIPSQTFDFDYYPCCVDIAANCWRYVDCENRKH